jgi:hypothetical protein
VASRLLATAFSLRRLLGVFRKRKSKSTVATGAPCKDAAALPIKTASRPCSCNTRASVKRAGRASMLPSLYDYGCLEIELYATPRMPLLHIPALIPLLPLMSAGGRRGCVPTHATAADAARFRRGNGRRGARTPASPMLSQYSPASANSVHPNRRRRDSKPIANPARPSRVR